MTMTTTTRIGPDNEPHVNIEAESVRDPIPEITREALAEYVHIARPGWLRYVFGKCGVTDNPSGDLVIPEDFVEQWKRRMGTPYFELTEGEKSSSQAEARKILFTLRTGRQTPW